MAGRRISNQEKELILSERSKGALCRQIVKTLSLAGYNRTLASVASFCGRTEVDQAMLPGRSRTAEMPATRQVGPSHQVEPKHKVVFLPDLHIPYHNNEVVEHVIENHPDAAILVLGGDVIDAYSVSKWPKRQVAPFGEECTITEEWLSKICGTFKKVIAINGNHDERYEKMLVSALEADVRKTMQTEILSILTENNNVIYNPGYANWFTQIGRCIFAHPTAYSKIPLRTIDSVKDFFLNRRIDYDCIVIGHLHKIGSMIRSARLYIESGAACMPMGYEFKARLLYKEPIASGYTVVYMDDNGGVNYNETKNVYLGTKTLDTGPSHKITS